MKDPNMSEVVLRRKYDAFDDFLGRLRGRRVWRDVVKVVLYGSVLSGDASEESDVDLLIIASGDVTEVDRVCGDVSFEVLMHAGELIEPMVYCLDEYRAPHYFVRSVLTRGSEVYSMTEAQMRRREAEDLLDLAREYLAMARSMLDGGSIRGSVDLGYNAAELCVKGLLLLQEGEFAKTHTGLVRQFGKKLVQENGLVPPSLGRGLRRGLERRSKARYDPHAVLSAEDGQQMVGLAEEMVEMLERELLRE